MAVHVVTSQEAVGGLGEANDLQIVSNFYQPGPTSWRSHGPPRLHQSGEQAINTQNCVWYNSDSSLNIDEPVRITETIRRICRD